MKEKITIELIKDYYRSNNFPFFESGLYNINMIGIRSSNLESNSFDDLICLVYKNSNDWVLDVYESTLDPGSYWLKNPMNKGGTAIVVEGYHPGLWSLSKFKGKDCLRQRTAVSVYRDSNRDEVLNLNPNSKTRGWYGILMHEHFQSNEEAENVFKSSAGCQVPKNRKDMYKITDTVKLQQKNIGTDIVSYLIVNESDILTD